MAKVVESDFASVLSDLLLQTDDETTSAPLAATIDYLSVANELHSGRIDVSEAVAEAQYLDAAAWLELEAEAMALLGDAPGALPSTDPAEIRRELDLGGASAAQDFDRLRRIFAFANHPDRVPEEFRDRAIVRMQEANRLIDEAKKNASSA